ncbi:MAG: hypothetical protein ACTSW7_01015 [Candidatus Thorarchaeota archaeon]|nr:MAG: hypothetical protein DRQ25_04830 [Candidatus Fermentibacteria bacterium]HEC72044.1 hypothetical protein [Thermoplasmatales archaeon]
MNNQLDNAIADRVMIVIAGMFGADPSIAQSLFDFRVNVGDNDTFTSVVPTHEIFEVNGEPCRFIGLFHILNAMMSPVQTEKHNGCSRLSLIRDEKGMRIVKTEELE